MRFFSLTCHISVSSPLFFKRETKSNRIPIARNYSCMHIKITLNNRIRVNPKSIRFQKIECVSIKLLVNIIWDRRLLYKCHYIFRNKIHTYLNQNDRLTARFSYKLHNVELCMLNLAQTAHHLNTSHVLESANRAYHNRDRFLRKHVNSKNWTLTNVCI